MSCPPATTADGRAMALSRACLVFGFPEGILDFPLQGLFEFPRFLFCPALELVEYTLGLPGATPGDRSLCLLEFSLQLVVGPAHGSPPAVVRCTSNASRVLTRAASLLME